ncbi:FHA domain-containing protein [Rippkaea orientalis PCC 8801]|uniref:FHA domain-containing protein n=2 Tax=Rippkaea TaxID=2546365 RepID=B7K065_RIPO1|nr:FHA domain-containing protein [Rippkaea orientalis PCC 8801]
MLIMRSLSIPSFSLTVLLLLIGWGLIGCSDRLEASQPFRETTPQPVVTSKLAEVAPPSSIQELRQALDQYEPQVNIISPQKAQVFSETSVAVKLEVKDYPLFKDPDLAMGPHLHLILDNNPYQAVYSVDEPIILENLTPGTHTLRVFASRPWHESFKNDGAYDQTNFHILTKTEDNAPEPSLPLLTYSRPNGQYGAEPIMLDFYLTNAPLHQVAQASNDDSVADWRIRATINGESFLLDTWQPIYLTGFQEGNNWVQLEFIDEQGDRVNNAFNNTVRVITYEPKGQDTLSKLVRGELSSQMARAMVDPNYTAELTPTPTVETEVTSEETSDTAESEPIINEEVPTTETQSELTVEESLTPEAEETQELNTEMVPEETVVIPDSLPLPEAETVEPESLSEKVDQGSEEMVSQETEPSAAQEMVPPIIEENSAISESESLPETTSSSNEKPAQNLFNSFKKLINFDQIFQTLESLKTTIGF